MSLYTGQCGQCGGLLRFDAEWMETGPPWVACPVDGSVVWVQQENT